MASQLTPVGTNMKAAGTRIKSMEQESSEKPMGEQKKAALHTATEMAWFYNGTLVETCIKALTLMINGRVSL